MDTIQVYPDKSGKWRWRKRAANNRTTADSSESYEDRAGAIEAARREREDERIVLLRQDGSEVGELAPENIRDSIVAQAEAILRAEALKEESNG